MYVVCILKQVFFFHLSEKLKLLDCFYLTGLKNFTGCEPREISNGFRFEELHVTWPEFQLKHWGWWLGVHPLSETYYCSGIASNCVICNAEMACVLFNLFICGWSFEAICSHCVIRFHIQNLGTDRISGTTTILWELKSVLPRVLRCVWKHNSKK